MSQEKLVNTYTPEEIAEVLRVKKNTVYQLISRGEIIAKKIGKFYRIPYSSISFTQTGLDNDLYLAEQVDLKNIESIHLALKEARS